MEVHPNREHNDQETQWRAVISPQAAHICDADFS
jgi:hypothetical protein